MNLLISTVQKEKQRIDYMLDCYSEKLKILPKGSVASKTVKGNTYYYIKYRDGKKVVSAYLGKDEVKIDEIRKQLEKRKHIEAMIKSLLEEQALSLRILEE